MESILCTQCQTNNPRYTKFCLTCGSAVSPPRELPKKSAKKAAETETAGEVKVYEETRAEITSAAKATRTGEEPEALKKDSGGWLRNLIKFRLF